MGSLRDLPHGLLVLLLLPSISHGILSNYTTPATNSTSPFDPFYALRLRTNSKLSDSICCLIPLSSEPLPTAAEFLSFEEWKSKQRELQAQAQAANQTLLTNASAPDALTGTSAAPPSSTGDSELPGSAMVDSVSSFSPHVRVPLTDRFNYASLECSARVRSSHTSARSPAAILSSKKDKYMLSPCSANPNFLVIELCDDIRIDTVQLANFEFFSGVFRDFKVSVAQTHTSDGQGWVEVGIYRAKNIRGVQSFHPLAELRPFYRYIRIDFLSHYGNEFYCPISLLRVYGLTQMEEWKWEIWQSGSENNVIQMLPENEGGATSPDTVAVEVENGTIASGLEINSNGTAQETLSNFLHPRFVHNPFIPHMLDSRPPSESQAAKALSSPPLTASEVFSAPSVSQRKTAQGIVGLTTSFSSASREAPANTSMPFHVSSVHPNSTAGSASINASHSASSLSGSSVQSAISSPSASPITFGESVYRTIMNRLAMLETNTTLYQQYVEEQTLHIREALRRLEENVGRLEGISKSQQQTFSKAMRELERKRRQVDEERWELLIKVNHLADEVMLEKRLGIAQLCLLLAVLVFMALTRGSRVSLLDGTMHRLNSFSQHRTWTSVDWSRKRRLSRSRTPTPMDYAKVKKAPKEDGREIVISSSQRHGNGLQSPVPFPTTPPVQSQTPQSLARPQTTPRRPDISRVTNESRPMGRLRRSNSHTTPAGAGQSAKRFAHTAHLHEVQPSARHRETLVGAINLRSPSEGALVLGDASPKPRRRRTELFSTILATGKFLPSMNHGEESDAGSWVDTEGGLDSDSEEGAGEVVGLKADRI